MDTLDHKLRSKEMIELVLFGNCEDPIDMMLTKPRLHHHMCRLKPMFPSLPTWSATACGPWGKEEKHRNKHACSGDR